MGILNRFFGPPDIKKLRNQSDTPGLYKALFYENVNKPGVSTQVRRSAIDALGSIGDSRAVTAIIAALKNPFVDVRLRAIERLDDIYDARAVDPLIAMLKDTSPDIRTMAVRQLGNQNDIRAIDPLISALKDTSSDVRRMAVFKLKHFDDDRVVEPLIATLKDTSDDVRVQALSILSSGHSIGLKIGDTRAIELLITALKGMSPDVRESAILGLGSWGRNNHDDRAIESIIAALKDTSPDVRKSAISSLKEINTTEVKSVLKDIEIQEEEERKRLEGERRRLEVKQKLVPDSGRKTGLQIGFHEIREGTKENQNRVLAILQVSKGDILKRKIQDVEDLVKGAEEGIRRLGGFTPWDVSVSGYDNNSQELMEIKEVRRWCSVVHKRKPFFPVLLSEKSLRWYLLCLLELKITKTGISTFQMQLRNPDDEKRLYYEIVRASEKFAVQIGARGEPLWLEEGLQRVRRVLEI